MNEWDDDRTVPVSDLMDEHNPFRDVPAPKVSYRPTPSLVIAMAMLAMWSITTLAQDWAAFREVAGLVAFAVFFLMTAWARAK